MAKGKVLRNYVSPLDQFLNKFDQERPELSKNQKIEIAKAKRIARLRDTVTEPTPQNKLPEGF